eukprot:2929601-Heterocapsa_arctica.AAC.1
MRQAAAMNEELLDRVGGGCAWLASIAHPTYVDIDAERTLTCDYGETSRGYTFTRSAGARVLIAE